MRKKILIVEDEFIVANDLRLMLMKRRYEICGIAASVEQARKLIPLKKPDWVLLDITLKTPTSGIDLAKELRDQKIPFLYISANTNERTLEAAKATQPYGFLVKPFRERDLFVMLDIACYRYDVETGVIKNKDSNGIADLGTDIIGESTAIAAALRKVQAVADATTSVLVLGESGTGKEQFARAVHKLSRRSSRPFITVNCAALPLALMESELFGHERGAFTGANQKKAGKFERADGGTIFLDEIGELSLEAQVKLLRVLQEREIEPLGGATTAKIDVRIIAATNKNLEKEVAEGRFRLDLYYRLNIFPIELPPLRCRKEDLPALVHHFLHKFSQKTGKLVNQVSDPVLKALSNYDWPGNIRELEHTIERSVILAESSQITEISLPEQLLRPSPAAGGIETLEQMEKNHILKALKVANGRVSGSSGAAVLLGIPAQTLYSKMKKLGIQSGYN